MKMLMPNAVRAVKLYRDGQPLFSRTGIESQLDAMFSPTVQLRSGGYIVINQTEALVSIDVNSGRSTREHHIEDTALKTNCEAAEEIARQLRLRDLAGLIVIDFIDMDEKRNNRTVERRMKDALRNDRARIQVGRISHFGLLEMSRQRIRTSVLESSTEKCPHCGGTGHMRSVSSVALQLLRSLEETLLKGATHNQIVRTRPEIAIYVLNHKRAHLMALEQRFHISISVTADPQIGGQPGFAIERSEQVMTPDQAKAIAAQALAAAPAPIEEEEPIVDHMADEFDEQTEQHAEQADDFEAREQPTGEREGGRGRRRRRRRGRGGERLERAEHTQPASEQDSEPTAVPTEHAGGQDEPFESAQGTDAAEEGGFGPQPHGDENGNGEPRRRRRGRRGGRRNRRSRDGHPNGNGGEPHADFHGDNTFPQQDANPGGMHAGGDMDRHDGEPPREASFSPVPPGPVGQQVQEAAQESTYEPKHEPLAAPLAEPPAAKEPPRRRSTVREPAPVSGQSAPAATPVVTPAPEPAVVQSSSSHADAGKPRRTGWWAKRLLGDKS
jgi:ribonuclease E